MTNSTITKTIFLPVDETTAWAYLTEADKLGRWFHRAEADLVAGEDYALVADDNGAVNRMCWGKVLEMEKPRHMVWSFTVKPLNGAMTTVTWTLEAAAGGTRITLVHEGVEEAAAAGALPLLQALDKGWDEHFGRLRPLLVELTAAAEAATCG